MGLCFSIFKFLCSVLGPIVCPIVRVSFDHCIFCLSSIYSFLLLLWYLLITPVVSSDYSCGIFWLLLWYLLITPVVSSNISWLAGIIIFRLTLTSVLIHLDVNQSQIVVYKDTMISLLFVVSLFSWIIPNHEIDYSTTICHYICIYWLPKGIHAIMYPLKYNVYLNHENWDIHEIKLLYRILFILICRILLTCANNAIQLS